MRLTLLAAALTAMTLTACGRPNQALPEQERENFERITSQPGGGQATGEAPDADGASSGSTEEE